MQPKHTMIEVLQGEWWIGVVAFGVALVLTPVVRFVAYRVNVVDRPDELLKPHGRPIAYLGGVAMLIGLLAGLAAMAAVIPDRAAVWNDAKRHLATGELSLLLDNPLWNLLGIALGSTVMACVGLLDDLLSIRPLQKIAGQVVAAGIFLAGGVGHRMALLLLQPVGLGDVIWLGVPMSIVMFIGAMVCVSNATNLLDGLDGLCGGVTGIIALGFLAIGAWLAAWGGRPGLDELRVGVCLAMAGAVLGFLPYNIPPASIFMGDAGSMLLGGYVATMMAMFCVSGNARWFAAACMVFALPILDTSLAVVRRFRAGTSIFAGDRSHLYDQLVDRGMSVKQVVVLFYALATATAAIGVGGAIFLRLRYALPLYAILLILAWIAFLKLGMISPPARGGPDTAAPGDDVMKP